jgi:serine/threonine-protein kinase
MGRYELLLPIGSGGMATVYLARAKGPGGFERNVALKLTHARLRDQPSFALEMLDEAKLAARIRHPNVVSVLDVGDDPLGVFLVMEYVEGDTLNGLVRRGGPLPPRIGARILVDALAGLHAAHELTDAQGVPLGLVHRDFSPQNLLVGIDGVTRLTDFGIAKAASRLAHTSTGVVKGKVSYMSPEQARGMQLDRRSDLWAAGVVAWEIVAGRRLYAHDREALDKVVSEVPPRLRQVKWGVDPALDDAVALALDSRIGTRPRTAADFRARLVEAFRAGAGIAETDEVAAHVSALLASELAERSARVEQVVAQRERLHGVGVPIMGETAQPPAELVTMGGDPTAQPVTATVTVRLESRVAAVLPFRDATGPRAEPGRGRRRLWALVGLGLAVAGVVAGVALRTAARASGAAEATSATAAPPVVATGAATAEPSMEEPAKPPPQPAPSVEASSQKVRRKPAPLRSLQQKR